LLDGGEQRLGSKERTDKSISQPVNFLYNGMSLNLENAATQEPGVPMHTLVRALSRF
jgi:hypothetical protein